VPHITQQDLADLSRIDAHILQSELIVTRQQKLVDNLERAGNDSSLSRSVLRELRLACNFNMHIATALCVICGID